MDSGRVGRRRPRRFRGLLLMEGARLVSMRHWVGACVPSTGRRSTRGKSTANFLTRSRCRHKYSWTRWLGSQAMIMSPWRFLRMSRNANNITKPLVAELQMEVPAKRC